MADELERLGQGIKQLGIEIASGAYTFVCAVDGLYPVKGTGPALFYKGISFC